MIRIIKNNSPLIITLCILMVTQLVGCGDDADDVTDAELTNSEAPPLPPDESMMVDLSLFDENVAMAPSAAAAATYKNFTNAVARVGVISSALVAAAATPAAVFAAARLNEPVEQEPNTWLWSYSVEIDYVTFAAALTGVEKGTVTDWSMALSTDAVLYPVDDFVWYTGSSAGSNLSGSWQFFDMRTPDEQNPVLTFDWSVSPLQEEVKLTLENVDSRADNDYLGDVLNYDLTISECSLAYEDASKGEVWDVRWNLETKDGSIKVPDYNDGEKACWNADKQDIECN